MEKRFIMPSIVSVMLIIISLFLQFYLPVSGGGEYSGDAIPIIPGGMFSDLVISLLIPFLFMLIMLFLGPIIALSLVRLHKLIKLNKYDYFIVVIEKKLSGSRILLRAILPGLLAINIAIYISLYGAFNTLFHQNGADLQNLPAVIEWIAVLIGIPIVCIIVLPLWMLESSGLMCSKRIESYNRPVTPDIEGVGHFYIQILKGYVSISTVIAYSLILYQFFITSSSEITFFIVFIDPIIIMLILMPISLLIEMRSRNISARLGSYYEKLSIDPTPRTIKIE